MSSQLIKEAVEKLNIFAQQTSDYELNWKRCEREAAEAKATLDEYRQELAREMFQMDYADLEENLERL